MIDNLNKNLNEVLEELRKINLLLKEDQQNLPKQQAEKIEQSNINKLSSRNKIDVLIKTLNEHPDWPLLQNKVEQSRFNTNLNNQEDQEQVQLWFQIQDELRKTNQLIEINQQVINSSLAYYNQIFTAIVKAGSNETDLVYEKKTDKP